MPLSSHILRTLLAALIGLAPLLCCCGMADAAAAESVPAAAEHSCCEQQDNEPAQESSSSDEGPHSCDCGSHVMAMQQAGEVNSHAVAGAPFPVFPPTPLPDFVASAFADVDSSHRLSASNDPVLPPAPTLRALSVLLLT